MTMPFGKYKGRNIENIPLDYLKWLHTIDLRELADDVEDEIRFRLFQRSHEENVINLDTWKMIHKKKRAVA